MISRTNVASVGSTFKSTQKYWIFHYLNFERRQGWREGVNELCGEGVGEQNTWGPDWLGDPKSS